MGGGLNREEGPISKFDSERRSLLERGGLDRVFTVYKVKSTYENLHLKRNDLS